MKKFIIALLVIAGCKPSDKLSQVVGVPKASTLENVQWVLAELNGQPVNMETRKPHLNFGAEGMVLSGFGGCNQLAGSYEASGKKLKLNNVASTRMFCHETQQIENDFLQILQKVNRYQIEGHELLLFEEDVLLARFRAEH